MGLGIVNQLGSNYETERNINITACMDGERETQTIEKLKFLLEKWKVLKFLLRGR